MVLGESDAAAEELDSVASETAGAMESAQGAKTPASGAGQKDASAEGGEKTPPEGDTSGAAAGKEGTEKEPMIPKSRLDEESRKVQTLTRRLKELEAIDGRLKVLGQRFGRGSQEYLDALERFYAAREAGGAGGGQPKPEDRIARVEAGLEEIRDQERIREERGKIEQELAAVRDNVKYSVLKGSWEKWQKVILGRMSADLDLTAEDTAQELVDLLNASRTDYVKTKTEEGKRHIESGGGGAPPGRKEEKFTKMRDLDRMVDTAVKGARSRPVE